MTQRLDRLLLIAAASALLAACGGEFGTKDDAGTSGAEVVESTGSGATGVGSDSATTTGVGAGQTFDGNPLDDPAGTLFKRTIYFEYDSSDVVPEAQAIIEAHANYLASNPNAAITLEGHADERGTREYNIALGEQRARSVRRLMGLLGASGQQIRLISYGEERPVVEGHDDESWRLNRRVEILYRTR